MKINRTKEIVMKVFNGQIFPIPNCAENSFFHLYVAIYIAI